jgi:pimeloyl-ACP methyl ester carboxylesterase
MARQMNDLLVLIPGILGSQLHKGKDLIWGFPEGMRAFIKAKSMLPHLLLNNDDPTKPYLDDDVRATALVSMPQIVSGFFKADGYDLLRERLFEAFQLDPITPEILGNFLEFPYDWRRDNRAAAHRLQDTVNEALARWRNVTGNENAKAIFICHSMGGLVARYYLEVLRGWPNARALITLATPYRGAVNALDFLVNGYSTAGVDLTDVLHSCTSVYQLLPIYEMVDINAKFHRIAELSDLPNVSQIRAQQARGFHQEIQVAVDARPKNAYPIFYFSGVAQPTLQSAVLEGTSLKASRFTPEHFSTYLETGDGTVPYVSSIPPELSNDARGAHVVPACHAMIQSSDKVWEQLEMILNRLQNPNISAILTTNKAKPASPPPTIALQIDDVYTCDPIVLRALLLNSNKYKLEALLQFTDLTSMPKTLQLKINNQARSIEWQTDASSGAIGPLPFVPAPVAAPDTGWMLSITGLPEGSYRLKVQAVLRSALLVPVDDVFEVLRLNQQPGETQ